jgi:integrase
MSLYKRGGFWWMRFWFEGKLFQESTKAGDKQTAGDIERARRTQLARGEVGLVKRTKFTIAQLLDAYLEDLKLDGREITARIESNFKIAKELFGKEWSHDLKPKKLKAHQRERLALEEKPATINRRLELVRAAYHAAVRREDLLPGDVPKFFHLDESANVRKGFFTAAEIETLIPHLPEHLRDYVRFAFLCGWRKSECASLRWCDVDDGSVRLQADESKNGRARVLPLTGEIAEIVERRRDARKLKTDSGVQLAEFVFHHHGERIKEFRKSWKSATDAAGLPGRLFHDLRRSAVKNFVDGGVDEHTARRITGHRTRAVFDRYHVVEHSDLAQALAKVEQHNTEQRAKVATIAESAAR